MRLMFLKFRYYRPDAGLCRARTGVMALTWWVLCSSGCSPILVDQPVDDLPAPDPSCHIDRLAGFVQRRSLFPRLVGSVVVVVLRVLAEDLAEVSFTMNWTGVLMIRTPAPAST